jgi:hypothetical protein
MKRKAFEQLFANHINNGKEVWIPARVRELPDIVVQIACNLLALEFIKYMRIDDEKLIASSEYTGTRVKMPITRTHHDTAIGIEIYHRADFETIDFSEINSPITGCGSAMVDAVLKNFPADWTASVFDYSGGFWDKIKDKYAHIKWLIL